MSETTSTTEVRRLLWRIADDARGGHKHPPYKFIRINGTTFTAVAKVIGVSPSVVQRWYNGTMIPRSGSMDLLRCYAFQPDRAESRKARVDHYAKLYEERGYVFDPPLEGDICEGN